MGRVARIAFDTVLFLLMTPFVILGLLWDLVETGFMAGRELMDLYLRGKAKKIGELRRRMR